MHMIKTKQKKFVHPVGNFKDLKINKIDVYEVITRKGETHYIFRQIFVVDEVYWLEHHPLNEEIKC